MTFDSLGLSADLVRMVAEEGYETPTPVQAAAIPLILVVCAFGAFALERLGFRLTMIAVLIVFLGVIERRNPLAAAAVAIGFALASYFLFATLLKVQLPRSPWGF